MAKKKLNPLRQPGPMEPAPFSLAEAVALKSLLMGEADQDQQKLATKWIIEKAAGCANLQWHPTDRDTSFSLGRAFVGQQLLGMLTVNISSLRSQENV